MSPLGLKKRVELAMYRVRHINDAKYGAPDFVTTTYAMSLFAEAAVDLCREEFAKVAESMPSTTRGSWAHATADAIRKHEVGQ